MTDFPLWISIPVALLVVIGSTLVLLGAVGLIRLTTFYQRMHAPSLIASWGTGALVLGSMMFHSGLEGKPVLHAIIIGIFVMVTTPITMLLLGRAALQRDHRDLLPDTKADTKADTAPSDPAKAEPKASDT